MGTLWLQHLLALHRSCYFHAEQQGGPFGDLFDFGLKSSHPCEAREAPPPSAPSSLPWRPPECKMQQRKETRGPRSIKRHVQVESKCWEPTPFYHGFHHSTGTYPQPVVNQRHSDHFTGRLRNLNCSRSLQSRIDGTYPVPAAAAVCAPWRWYQVLATLNSTCLPSMSATSRRSFTFLIYGSDRAGENFRH